MQSVDFNLSEEATTLFEANVDSDKKVYTIVVSNETFVDKQFSIGWDNQVLFNGTVPAQSVASVLDGGIFSHEANEELSAIGDGLTLHMVFGEYHG